MGKDRHSFAFFNLSDGAKLTLSERKRAGKRYCKDHTVMPKRPKTQPAPGENPVDAVKNLAAGKAADGSAAAPKLPGMPPLPLPGTAPGAGGADPMLAMKAMLDKMKA